MREPLRECTQGATLEWRTAAARLWRLWTVLIPLSGGMISVGLGYTASMVWASPILARRFDLPPDRIGVIMGTILLISGILGALLGGTLADLSQRTGGPRRTITLLIVLALALVPAGFYGLMSTVVLVSVLLTLLCTICGMNGLICTSIASVVIPKELLGFAFGAISAMSAVFTSLSPVAVSALADHTGGDTAIAQSLTIVCIVTSLAGAAIFALGRRHFSKASDEQSNTDLIPNPRM